MPRDCSLRQDERHVVEGEGPSRTTHNHRSAITKICRLRHSVLTPAPVKTTIRRPRRRATSSPRSGEPCATFGSAWLVIRKPVLSTTFTP